MAQSHSALLVWFVGRWDGSRRDGRGAGSKGGFKHPHCSQTFQGEKIPRENRQEQLGKCPIERAADAGVFPSKREKISNKISASLFGKALKAPGKAETAGI